MEEHFASLAKQVAPATVNIQIGMAQGSGVVVTDDGYILTAAHVIGRPSTIATVTFPDGTKVDAQTLGLSRGLDFGMLKILEKEGDDFPHLEVGLSAELKRGQWVMAVGHPGGIDEKRGLVFRAGRIISNEPGKLQTDCTLVGGDSGGPLVDMDGAVIGIHSRIGSRLWDNLHAPIDVYSENWDRMDLDGVPYLGFTVKPNSNRVTVVSEGGPAKQAGIKPQDRIIEIEGQKVEDYSQLELAIVKLRPYQKATFKIKRRSKTLTFEVIVSETK
jgi:serine protease Do